VPLTPKAFDLLQALVEGQGHLLEKEELLKAVWPDAFVEEANLSHNISQIRRILGDGENGQRYVETVPKRGYRFVGAVREGRRTCLAGIDPTG
jgi:DNA-binding winged helix-turn-helix (wHTH) protein